MANGTGEAMRGGPVVSDLVTLIDGDIRAAAREGAPGRETHDAPTDHNCHLARLLCHLAHLSP